MRAIERDLLLQQKKFPESDYCYPIPREVDNLWNAPSDGGSQWMYSGFEHYYFERTHSHWSWGKSELLTREAVWKEWITEMMGK
jgi:hypothetical protein